jgi:hypothetical protein
VLGTSRVAVRKVLRSNSNPVPEPHRTQKDEPHRQQILELFDQWKGNPVRVHEELPTGEAKLSYTALMAFCHAERLAAHLFFEGGQRHGIGYATPTPAGLHGSGRDMVPVPEMAAFGKRFGFQKPLQRNYFRSAAEVLFARSQSLHFWSRFLSPSVPFGDRAGFFSRYCLQQPGLRAPFRGLSRHPSQYSGSEESLSL